MAKTVSKMMNIDTPRLYQIDLQHALRWVLVLSCRLSLLLTPGVRTQQRQSGAFGSISEQPYVRSADILRSSC